MTNPTIYPIPSIDTLAAAAIASLRASTLSSIQSITDFQTAIDNYETDEFCDIFIDELSDDDTFMIFIPQSADTDTDPDFAFNNFPNFKSDDRFYAMILTAINDLIAELNLRN